MTVLYLLSLDRTASLVFWAALVQIGAFYVARPHHEMLTEWGTEDRRLALMARAGQIAGFIAYAIAAYILYRVGFMPAVVALIVMFCAPIIVSTIDVWWIRSPARPMAMVCLPLTALFLVLMLAAALAL